MSLQKIRGLLTPAALNFYEDITAIEKNTWDLEFLGNGPMQLHHQSIVAPLTIKQAEIANRRG